MKSKKKIRLICGIAAVVFAVMLLLTGSYIYRKSFKPADIDSSFSDDGAYEVIFQSVGEPDFPFGASHARIVLRHSGKKVAGHKFDVANDGKDLFPENWSVSWRENCVDIIISGEEQPDALYTLNFDGTVKESASDGVVSESISGRIVRISDDEKARVEAEMYAAGELCRQYYINAEKIPAEYFERENIPQENIDGMEAALSRAGFCVVNTDGAYPEYLYNKEIMDRFWEDVILNQGTEAAVWSISPGGSMYCRIFQFRNGTGYCIHAAGEWNEDGSLSVSYLEKKEILFWDMTESGFIYQDVYLDRHWNAAYLLRCEPTDHALYDLTEKYISPIGYRNVNIFLLDWNSEDFGNLCFNDLLSGLYQMEYGERLYEQNYPYEDEPYPHSVIPAKLFESVIFEHFDITLEEFRKRALYDHENDAYPWQELNAENNMYYPEMIPEVTSAKENPDGTLNLRVNVICPDNHTDHLFEHEVTLKPGSDGDFKYLSNKIVYRCETELPSPQARIEAQHFDTEK